MNQEPLRMSEIVTFGGEVTPADRDSALDEATIERLLASVGERVRNARARMGLSRRALAEKSGVSQRYLAQLESGQGNISIALLLRIAHALDFRIEWLVAEEDPWTSEIVLITSLLRSATRVQRERVLEILDPENPGLRRAQRIAFIGLRGAGKSTLGRLTAAQLKLPFMELNEEIEQACGMGARSRVTMALTILQDLFGEIGRAYPIVGPRMADQCTKLTTFLMMDVLNAIGLDQVESQRSVSERHAALESSIGAFARAVGDVSGSIEQASGMLRAAAQETQGASTLAAY